MTRNDEQRIADMLEVADQIAALVDRGPTSFGSDIAVRFAIERLLEILGEAANAVSPATRERFPAVPWRDISRLRIVLAHHYHRVDPDQVWSMATHRLEPQLWSAVNQTANQHLLQRSDVGHFGEPVRAMLGTPSGDEIGVMAGITVGTCCGDGPLNVYGHDRNLAQSDAAELVADVACVHTDLTLHRDQILDTCPLLAPPRIAHVQDREARAPVALHLFTNDLELARLLVLIIEAEQNEVRSRHHVGGGLLQLCSAAGAAPPRDSRRVDQLKWSPRHAPRSRGPVAFTRRDASAVARCEGFHK